MPRQLRILLVGTDRRMAETGDALVGRKAFSKRQSRTQRETSVLPDGRVLEVTTAHSGHVVPGSDDVKRLSEELVSDIASTVYHAVLFIMGIQSNFCPAAAECMMADKSWKNFVKKKGVIVVIGGERLGEEQNKGEITVSFLDWVKRKGDIFENLLREMQMRWISLNEAESQDVLNKQRDELVDMIDSRVLGEGHYTDLKFNEAKLLSLKVGKSLQDLKQEVSKENAERIGVTQIMQDNFDKESKEAAQRSERLEKRLTDFENVCKKDSEKATRDSQNLDTQLLKCEEQVLQEQIKRKEEVQTMKEEFERRFREMRNVLLILLLLLLLLFSLFSLLWPVTSNSRRENAALNVSSLDLKLEKAVKRMQDIEKHLADQMKSPKLKELNETDPNNVSKIRQEMVEQFTELKERLLNDTADLTKDIRKNITGSILVWDMIESLPLSLPLIMVLTLLLLLLTPVPLPVPWASLLGASLVALQINN